MPEHIHLLVSIPPKMSVSSFMGYLMNNSRYYLIYPPTFGNRLFRHKNACPILGRRLINISRSYRINIKQGLPLSQERLFLCPAFIGLTAKLMLSTIFAQSRCVCFLKSLPSFDNARPTADLAKRTTIATDE